jgi:hypothetical protein
MNRSPFYFLTADLPAIASRSGEAGGGAEIAESILFCFSLTCRR